MGILTYACVVYEPVPAGVYYPPPASSFDRVWDSALRAADDAGIEIVSANRDTGTILGRKGTTEAEIFVSRQADGRMRVELNLRGPEPRDPTTADRFYRSYERYMGR
jgi:hypothetical protein